MIDIARRTAKHLGVDMYVKDMNEAELAKHFEDCIWHNEHHAWDLDTVGKFALSEISRRNGFMVILSGEGADELFAGYPWFVPEILLEPDPASPDLHLQKDGKLRTQPCESALQDILAVFGKVVSDSNPLDMEPELKARLNNTYSPYAMASRIMPVEVFPPALRAKYTAMDQLRRVIDAWSPSAQEKMKNKWHPLHTAMYAWIKYQLPNFILTALGDRCEMAHSIEGRPPFLDHRPWEYMGNMPPSLEMRYSPGGKGWDAGGSAWASATPARPRLASGGNGYCGRPPSLSSSKSCICAASILIAPP